MVLRSNYIINYNTFIASVYFFPEFFFFSTSCKILTGISLALPCCQRPVTLCPSQHDGVSGSGPAACSGGASLCALFSGEEKSKRLNLELHHLWEATTPIIGLCKIFTSKSNSAYRDFCLCNGSRNGKKI